MLNLGNLGTGCELILGYNDEIGGMEVKLIRFEKWV